MATCKMCGTTIKGAGVTAKGKKYCSKNCSTLDAKHGGAHKCEFC